MQNVRFFSVIFVSLILLVSCARMPSSSFTGLGGWFVKNVLGYQCHAMTCRGAE